MNKKLKIVLGCIIVIIVSGFIACRIIVNTASAVKINNVYLNRVQDGSYTGTYQITPVTVKLQVVVNNHRITSITLLKHNQGLGKPAEALLDKIVEKQSIDLDVISGATVSSKSILKATEKALMKGQTHE